MIMTSDLTPARYVGKVCARHPEANGVRYKCSYRCVECARAAVQEYLDTNDKAMNKHKKYVTKWRKKNKDRINARVRLRRAQAKEAMKKVLESIPG